MSETKQVIIMRKDLKMRKGKMCSQAAHASMKVLLDMMTVDNRRLEEIDPQGLSGFGPLYTTRTFMTGYKSPLNDWLNGLFTKITVGVDSLDDLMHYYNLAKERDIPCALIEDAGLTEFNGRKTITCCAIGPHWNEQINDITGELKLL